MSSEPLVDKPKRGPGRPKMTEEEKAASKARSAAKKEAKKKEEQAKKEKQRALRDKMGRFLPGKSGNPEGLGRDKQSLRKKAQEYTDLALETVVDITINGETSIARLAAAKILLERGHGKAIEKVEHSGTINLVAALQTAADRRIKGQTGGISTSEESKPLILNGNSSELASPYTHQPKPALTIAEPKLLAVDLGAKVEALPDASEPPPS